MEKLTVVSWLWGDKYGPKYAKRLAASVQRNLKQGCEFVLVCDTQQRAVELSGAPIDRTIVHKSPLYSVKGCFVRLVMFSPDWQKQHGITGRLVCIDLDTVITGPLDPLFDREEPYVIMSGGNAANPCPFAGALQMLRAGAHPEVWSEFTLKKAAMVPYHEFHDDQGWLHHKLPGAATWKCGPETGVYVFQKTVWPRGENLPKGARLVTFNGHRDPAKFEHVPWIKENWR